MAGFYEGTDLADKVFHGFRLNPDDGNLNVEIIDSLLLKGDDLSCKKISLNQNSIWQRKQCR